MHLGGDQRDHRGLEQVTDPVEDVDAERLGHRHVQGHHQADDAGGVDDQDAAGDRAQEDHGRTRLAALAGQVGHQQAGHQRGDRERQQVARAGLGEGAQARGVLGEDRQADGAERAPT